MSGSESAGGPIRTQEAGGRKYDILMTGDLATMRILSAYPVDANQNPAKTFLARLKDYFERWHEK